MHLIDVAGPSVDELTRILDRRAFLLGGAEPLELAFGACQHVDVEQVAQLVAAEQLPQQVGIERQRGRAAFGQRRVVLVHVLPDPAEQQRLRHR